MYDAFGIYYDEDENLGLLAAGSRWTSGGNSKLARRARVAMQRRDRYGRWAEMGGGIAFPGRNSDGKIVKMVGRYVGPAEREGYMRVYVTEGRGIRPGIYEVPCKVATVAKALLSEKDLGEAGVKLDVNGQRVGDVLDRDIEFLDQMWKGQPSQFDLDMARKNLTKSEQKSIVKARLKAPAHKSYNIVDEKGNRVDKDEPVAPVAKKATKAAEVFPIPDVSNVIGADGKPIDPSLLKWYVDANGVRIPDSRLKDSDRIPENLRVRDLVNHRVLDGNGHEVKFAPKYSPEADPRPAQHPDHEDGFWDANEVKPEEVLKDITDPQVIYEELYDGGFVEVSEEAAIEALKIAMADRKFIGPDDNAIGASKLAREVSSALESLPQAQVNRLRRSINPAALNEERARELLDFIQGKDGQPLTADEMKMLHRKYRNLGVDLTNMKIAGKSSYTNNNLGAERGRMPQLATPEDQADFEAALDKLGIKHTEATFTPDQLTPVQAEMDMGNVGKIMESWLSPELRAKYKMDEQVLYVTRDGYVIDGHHRWASALLAQKASGKPINLKCVVVDLDHEDALRICNEYNDHIGVTRQTLGATSANAEATPKREVAGEVGRKATLPKAEDLLVPAGERAQIRQGQAVMNRAPSGPDGTPLDDWLKSHLDDKGDEIIPLFNDLLTEDKQSPDPEHGVEAKIPGSRTMVANLIAFRNSLKDALKGAALDGNEEEFAFKYAIAQRVAKMLNQIHSNLANGLDYRVDTEFAGSTEDPKLRLAQARILPKTMKTSIDNYGNRTIDKFDAVVIAKNGEPFLLKFRNGEVDNYHINPDGSIGDKAGHLEIYNMQEMEVRPDGSRRPKKAKVFSAFQTEDRTKALGLMTSSVLLARWVQHQYGSYMGHSSNLRPNGNFYSKKVSRNMRWADRTQADKNVHTQNPNADIFKVLKSMGLIDGEYIPYDPNAATEAPGGWGGNSGGTGWLKRLTIINNRGASDNYSVLNSHTEKLESIITSFYNSYSSKSAEEKQQILDQIPPVFKKFFTEKGNPIDDFDVQYKLLGTAYKGGMSKEQTVEFLKSIEDGIPAMCRIFGSPEDTFNTNLKPIKDLRAGVEAHAWNPENNKATEAVFDTNWLRTVEQPFSGKFKFQEWNVPKGTSAIFNNLPYANGARPEGAPANWDDNPSTLKANFSADELFAILRDSIIAKKGKTAHIPEKDGASGFDVNPNAVYKALENHGVDSEMMLAQIYDEVNGDSANVDAINAARADNGNLNDIISQLRAEIGELDEPTAFDQIGGTFENGILKADLVKRQEENVGGDPALNFQPLLPNEAYVDSENGRARIQAGAYVPEIPNRDFYISGVTDNPKLIARNFSPMGLKNALISAIDNRMVVVKLEFANGSTRDVPLAAIRDALQYQGVDITPELENHPGLKKAPKEPYQLGEVIEDNGSLRKRINFYSFGDGQPADSPHLYEEQVKDINTYELQSYDLGIADNSTDRNGKIKIAKIVKNADGKFEVWVASRSEGRTEDFSGEPMGVYDNWKNAYYDVAEFIKRDMNLRKGTYRLVDDQLPPTAPTRDFNSTLPSIDDNNPDAVTLDNGIVLTRPDDVSNVQIYSQPLNGNRIPGAVDGGNSAAEAYTVTTNITAQPSEAIERFTRHTIEQGEDGQPVQKSTDIYTLSSLGGLEYRVTLTHPTTGNTESYEFDDSIQARAFAKAYYQGMYNNPAKLSGWLSQREHRDLVNGITAQIGEQQQSQTSDSVTKVSQIRLKGGVKARVEVTVKKGVHPAWRRGAGFADNNYTYAEVRITNPNDPEDVYFTARLSRTGEREWRIRSSVEKSGVDALGTFNHFSHSISERNKDTAARRLGEILNFIGGNDNDKKLMPEVQVVDAPGGRAPRQAVAAPGRGENKFSPEHFADFVAERAQLIDVTGYTDNGYIGDGASGAIKITLADGRVFKFKSEGEDKARQESFNHALYALAGVQVTEGRLGLNNGEAVLADAFQPVIRGNWRKAFTNRNFTNARYAQAIADFHEGVPLDLLLNQWDLRGNEGNAFLVPDENGVLRGMRCDAGSGGLYHAIGAGRHAPGRQFNGNAKDMLINHLGDIMRNGVSSQFNEEERIYRGLTKDALIASARRTILPLTDDKIDTLVNAIIENPQDRADLAAGLKRRRLELLNYLGIDPNEEPLTGEQGVAPANIPGNTPKGNGLDANGYEFVASVSDGRPGVRIKGTLRPDGIFVAENFSALPLEIRSGIQKGEIVPTNLPFLSKSVPADGLPRDAAGNYTESLPIFVDSEGIVRQSPYGATSVMIRKRMADGTYKYLYVTPKNADPTAKAMWSGKYAPLHQPKLSLDQPDPTPQELMMSHLGVSVDPVSVTPIVMRIPGGFGNHKILIADIGDQDLDLATAQRRGLIGESVWREADRLNSHQGSYWNQFGRNNIHAVAAIKNAESVVFASPSNQHDEEPNDAEMGNGGNGPSNPDSPQDGGPSGPRDSDGYRLINVFNPIGADGQPITQEPIQVGDYADGSLKVKNQAGLVLGRVQPTYHDHWVATYMPNDITGRNGNNRNGDAVKAIFATKAEADTWLSHKIGDFYGTPADARRALVRNAPLGPNRPVAKFEVKKGFLNETTQDQRNFAERLIEQKVATSEERALYRAILSQDKLTVGEVGWVIGQLRDNENRSPDEIEASRQAREDAVTAEPIGPSVMDNAGNVNETVAVRARDLQVGQRILGNVNGNVVFTAVVENNTMNVGVVGDDGKLRVYQVGRNSIVAINNQAPAPAPANANVPVHPVIAQRRRNARLIQDRIKATYPNARELPNGDLIVGQRDHRQADGSVFRYEAIVHKLKSDEFVSYVRKQQIDGNGNPVGNGTAAYFTQPGHSPRAVIGRLGRIVVPVLAKQNPANGFNQRDDQTAEIINPATGLPIPSRLANADAQFIGDTGIEKTGNAVKDALISYVKTLVARGMAQPDIINQVLGGNQNLFTSHQMDDIIERLEWNRQFPGVNAIPYVSKDNKTIVRVGDRVTHYDAFGNPILMANGQPRTGIVTDRRPYTLNVKPNGEYEYTDQLYVKWDNASRPTQAAARRVEVNRRGDGSAPVPAVQGPGNSDGNANDRIAPMPLPIALNRQGRPLPPVVNDPLADAFTSAESFGQGEVDAINGRATLPAGMEVSLDGGNGGIRVHPQGDRGGSNIARILQVQGGYEAITLDNNLPNGDVDVNSTTHPTKLEAVNAMLSRLNGDSEPSTEVVGQVNQVVNLPPNGRVDRPEMAKLVETLYDTETPRHIYDVVRDENGTKFVVRNGDNMGAEAFVTVVRTQDGWVATDPRVPARDISGRILYRGPDRGTAEMRAINRMTGADGGQNPVTPDDTSLTPSSAPSTPNPNAMPNYNMLGMGNRENVAIELRRVLSPELDVRVEQDPLDPRVRVYSRDSFVGAVRQLEDGKYKAYHNDQNFNVNEQDFDNLQDAIDFLKTGLSREFPVQQNNEPEPPAEPSDTSVANMTIGGKDITRRRHADGTSEYYYNDNEVGRIERNANGGYDSIDVFSGDITSFNSEADAMSHQEALLDAYAFNGMFDSNNPPSDDGGDSSGGPSTPPPSGPDGGNGGNGGNPPPNPTFEPQPDNAPIPGKLPEPRQPLIPTDANGNPILPGANPATPGSQAPGAPQEPSVPQAPQAPNGPEPLQPGRVIPARPQGRPRVNPVQPGDRYVKYHAGRDGNYWDIRDSRTRKVIGRAATREIADEIALGVRDLNGKLIDYTTPIVPRTRKVGDRFPRPKGYKRTAVGQGYFLENPNDPNAPVVRVEFDRDLNKWVGRMYANKQDAVKNDPTKSIGTDTSNSQNEIESLANEGVQLELDRRNPPAPATPAQPQASQHTRTNFGSSVFAVHEGDNEYGVAKKGQDGKWSVNVFPTPADGNDASKSFFNGTFDTPDEAEAAIRKAIADKRATEQPENILQWQSGSDGKAYIGLDGVPGYDAENSPVWGLSPMPFGAGWFVGAWGKKSDKDAGMPPVGTSRIDDEAEARRFAQDSLLAWLERHPPTN